MEPSKFTTNLVLAMCLLGGSAGARAQEVQHLTITQPGGMPGLPVVTGITKTTNGVRVTWDGPSGYYRVLERLGLASPAWEQVSGPSLNRRADIATPHNGAFFRVVGPEPYYVGSQVCLQCHDTIHATEANTRHAHALETLKKIGQGNNPSCLPCHTVGYGLPSGFVDELTTAHLAGVQCENCHGPGGHHAANEMDLTVRPRRELAGEVCGGCHTDSHHPTYDEWKSSGHFAVVEDMNPSRRISSCGRCHSGSSRLAQLAGEDPALTVAGDANVGITCAVCHDPHGQHVWTNVLTGVISTNQLRTAIASTNDFFLTTSDSLAATFDPNINVCAQCHNHRGADWTSTSRPPHHSPQYNMLLGTVGELDPGQIPHRAAHATQIDKQCVGCHMQTEEYQSEEQPAVSGHSFSVETFDICLSCHQPSPEKLADFARFEVIQPNIDLLKGGLDLWATEVAPPTLATNYGLRAWEYSDPGELSSGGSGPSETEQMQIPDNIKKARFNLYLVVNDGSYGIHNPLHSLRLLKAAQNWVFQEIYE